MKTKSYLVILLAVALFPLLLNSCSTPTPSETVEDMLQQIGKGNVEKSVDYLATGEEGLTEEERQKLEGLYSQTKSVMDEKGGVKNVEILQEEIAEDGQSAVVSAKITYGDGSSQEMQQKMIMEDGKWKVTMEK